MQYRVSARYDTWCGSVEKGETIEVFPIMLPSNIWFDWFIPCGATGWGKLYGKLRRWNIVKNSNFGALCARIGEHTYEIGEGKLIEVPGDGDLILFANDLSFMRWNNFGSIDVLVVRR